MENVEIIISLAGTVLSLVIMCFIFINRFIAVIKKRNNEETDALIMDAVIELMTLAEKCVKFSGKDKKEFVFTKLNQFAEENEMKIDFDNVSEKIEKLIKLTKQVNFKK